MILNMQWNSAEETQHRYDNICGQDNGVAAPDEVLSTVLPQVI